MSCKDMFEFYLIHQLLHQELERCMGRCASFLGVSVAELQVLWIATASDTTTLTDIARITTYTKEQIEEVVASLERDRLLEQVSSGESLCTFLQATDEGTEIMRQFSNTPNRCRCPIKADDEGIQRLMADARELVAKLRGRGSCDLIAERACRGK